MRPQRFEVEELPGTVPEAIDTLNRMGLCSFVHSVHLTSAIVTGPVHVTVIWQFTDYPGYRWWCEKRGRTPVPTDVFFP